MGAITKRERLLTRWSRLQSERDTWKAHWQELSTYLLPRSGRFFVEDRNKGHRRHNSIFDSTGTRALRVLGAGLMAGATSPARPWFKLRTVDDELNDYHAVQVWLDETTKLMLRIFAKSNTYRALHSMYEELGCFGTAVSLVLPDYDNVIHHYPLTVGQYCLATDPKGEVNTLYREFQMTVAQLVKEFGFEKCSLSAQNLFRSGQLDSWVTVLHAIEPRENRRSGNPSAKDMPWSSIYFEIGQDSHKYLRESGFQYFPVLAPRWAITGQDVYGHSPGMEALGDVKQLQHEQLRKAQGIDYQSRPPLQVPSSMKNREIDTLPGGITFYDPNSQTAGIKTLFDVRLDLQYLLADIQDVRERIKGSFYADLFLMMVGSSNSRMTATEVAERHEEKLLMLGPVLERLHNELLAPLIETTFARMLAADILPPAPPEMQQVEINVEFVSMLAQAQRAVGTNAVDRWLGNVGAVAQYAPEVLDKVNTDYWCETYASMLGVDPKMIVPEDKAQAVRQERAQQEAQAQQAMAAEQQAASVAKLAQANGPDNNVTNVMDQLTGYNTPGVMPSS